MVVATMPAKKQEKLATQLSEEDIEKLINSGGKSVSKLNQIDTINEKENSLIEMKFTLRIPKQIIARVDKLRSKRAAKPSRNNWILDVIEKAVEKAEREIEE